MIFLVRFSLKKQIFTFLKYNLYFKIIMSLKFFYHNRPNIQSQKLVAYLTTHNLT
jgi:hypothetical protein